MKKEEKELPYHVSQSAYEQYLKTVPSLRAVKAEAYCLEEKQMIKLLFVDVEQHGAFCEIVEADKAKLDEFLGLV